ncbi:MAG: class I SAM-dependent methyltransferase [Magnetococcales bacterium]|nr:class I SAM-dependent methyltransferase [Magnetococcales bacterium]
MSATSFDILVAPNSRQLLHNNGDQLLSADGGESFALQDGIAMLLQSQDLSEEQQREQTVFDTLQLQGLPYFRPLAFREAIEGITNALAGKVPQNCVELGGGEGHFAARLRQHFPAVNSYVCDLSLNSLKLAANGLLPIFADITKPIFAPETLDVAIFWVSLHHLNDQEQKNAIAETARALRPGGVLMLYEPNAAFLPRQIVYKTALAQDVYADEAEKAVDFAKVAEMIKTNGLNLTDCRFISPPYNLAFVKKLNNWPLYMALVETLFRLDRLFIRPLVGAGSINSFSRHLTMYGSAIFIKK